MSGTEQAVVTHLDEAVGEHVLQEAADELSGRDSAVFELVSGRLFVSESDVAVCQLGEAVVADGNAKDIRGEILESLLTRADRFGVDHPVFAPDAGCD